jgi:hypothetical protein
LVSRGYAQLKIEYIIEKSDSIGESGETTLFSKLSDATTGIDFKNQINETVEFNYLTYPLIFNGGGVGLGDINNDGLTDIFLAGNMVSSRLYLNMGNMRFQDITNSAGVETERWITGVSMVDINNDGNIDIYLSVSSPKGVPDSKRANLLFINNGDETFEEKAKDYRIADTSHSTHALFLDYNKDGLVDLFLVNHSTEVFLDAMIGIENSSNTIESFDKLYKNNGDGTFTNVSKEAGILAKTGFGLGAVSADINRDGWEDIYISNDIIPDDVLYINNQDGTFSDKSKEYLKHTSYAGMGIDIADFNNDGWYDILQLDMNPADYHERKLMNYATNFAQYANKIIMGYQYQYNKNSLQLNNGLNDKGRVVFSEIGRLAGVAYTGWSWASLFGDYNNDGNKDIIITNGYPKAVNDYDYLIEQYGVGDRVLIRQDYSLYESLPDKKLRNYIFKNTGKLQFEDVSQAWGFTDSTYSYGISHGDLDNDGDLDLVINNINSNASIYQNNSSQLGENHYLTISLNGPNNNTLGLGTEIVVTTNDGKQYWQQTLYRGYQSSQDPRIHFGFNKESTADSIEVFWPDGKYQLLRNTKADQQIIVNYTDALEKRVDHNNNLTVNRPFKEITDDLNFLHKHEENKFNDYRIQPLLWQQLSHMGPKLAVGDVDNNGLDDLYIGGAENSSGTLYLQDRSGNFIEHNTNQPWVNDYRSEDMGAIFFDANGDNFLDLYVASGGYEISRAEDAILDRLYINHGNGRFIKDEFALPRMYNSTSKVVSGDFNADGQMDLFVGGRLVPYNYPMPAKSYILMNNDGRFVDVTQEVAPELVEPGLITDAIWTDFNTDGKLDLVITGIWLPVQFFENQDGKLINVTDIVANGSPRGWWYSLEKGDFNNDGAIDIVAGNLGLNHTFTTSDSLKFGVIAGNLDNDLTTDIIHTMKENDTIYPFFGKARIAPAMEILNKKYTTFESFSVASVSEIFEPSNLENTSYYESDTFASTIFKSQSDGTFEFEPLPERSQLSPIQGMIAHDVDRDGKLDLITAGNIFAAHPSIGRADGGAGLWMRGNGDGTFEITAPQKSGFFAPGDVKDLKLIKIFSGQALVIANNDGLVQLFKLN